MNLYEWRQKNGYTIARLAKEAGMARETLRRIEIGETNIMRGSVRKIAEFTGLTVDEIMEGREARQTAQTETLETCRHMKPKDPVQLWDRVTRYPTTFGYNDDGRRHALQGIVTYIHPDGRYHIVDFKVNGKRLRECFMGIEREEKRHD